MSCVERSQFFTARLCVFSLCGMGSEDDNARWEKTYRNPSTSKRQPLLVLDDLQRRARLGLPRARHDDRHVHQADGARREEQVAVVRALVLERGSGASGGELVRVAQALGRHDIGGPAVPEFAGEGVFQVDHVVVAGWGSGEGA